MLISWALSLIWFEVEARGVLDPSCMAPLHAHPDVYTGTKYHDLHARNSSKPLQDNFQIK